MNSSSATTIARDAKDSPVLSGLARSGFAVNGLLHILIGAIAIGVAAGAGGEADQSGALSALATVPGGAILLWIIVVGLAALALWQFLSALLIRGSDPKAKVTHTVKEVAKGVVFLAVAITAFTFARGGSSSSTGSSKSLSARLLSAPGGVFLLVVVGLGIAAVGVYFVYSGIVRRFTKDIRVPAGDTGRAVVTFGRVGYIAKGVAIAVVGVLFIVAAATSDPSKATGLDGALRSLRGLPFGVVILIVVGAGVIAYGVYCFARARLAKL